MTLACTISHIYIGAKASKQLSKLHSHLCCPTLDPIESPVPTTMFVVDCPLSLLLLAGDLTLLQVVPWALFLDACTTPLNLLHVVGQDLGVIQSSRPPHGQPLLGQSDPKKVA